MGAIGIVTTYFDAEFGVSSWAIDFCLMPFHKIRSDLNAFHGGNSILALSLDGYYSDSLRDSTFVEYDEASIFESLLQFFLIFRNHTLHFG